MRSCQSRIFAAGTSGGGAFLSHGSLTEPGRSSALEITCPGPEAALALVGAKNEGIRTQFHFNGSKDLVLVDRVQIQQVLLNLIRNAIEAMQDSENRNLAISAIKMEGGAG